MMPINILLMSVALTAIIPEREMAMCRRVSEEYGLNREQAALLVAIRRVENGAPGMEFGVASDYPGHPARRHKDGRKSFLVQARWCAGTIRKRYGGDLSSFARRYCPPNAFAWERIVRFYMRKALSKGNKRD